MPVYVFIYRIVSGSSLRFPNDKDKEPCTGAWCHEVWPCDECKQFSWISANVSPKGIMVKDHSSVPRIEPIFLCFPTGNSLSITYLSIFPVLVHFMPFPLERSQEARDWSLWRASIPWRHASEQLTSFYTHLFILPWKESVLRIRGSELLWARSRPSWAGPLAPVDHSIWV